jgi:hypothetical protein
MKLNQILTCAVAAGAMAFVSDQAQAAGTVIDNYLYVPMNIKGTFNYVAGTGKIKQATFTSKSIVAYEGYPKGTVLAIGPDSEVYAINKGIIIDNLYSEGYFDITFSEYIETDGDVGKTYVEADSGKITVDFYSDGYTTLTDNQYVFEGTGVYTYGETEGADNSKDYYHQTSQFKSITGGFGYDFDVSDEELPVTAITTGSASGQLLD